MRDLVSRAPQVIQLPIRQRSLLRQLARRDVEVRYKGSRLGIVWAMITPLFLLAVYTFVFGTIFKGDWPGRADAGVLDKAVIIFTGLVTMTLFTEPVVRASTCIISVPNFVKKVVFPLELIPMSLIGGALFHFLVSLSILLVGVIVIQGIPPLTALALPIVILPVVILSLAFSWFLASLGVFIRDLTYIVQLLVQVLMFMTPVFYPDQLVPAAMRPIVLKINPMAAAIYNMRQILIFGGPVNWLTIVAWIVVSSILAILSFIWFQRTKRAFADVI